MQVAFVRLNKSLIARNPKNTKSNNKTIFNATALRWLREEISNHVDIIVIYTGMRKKNAEQIYRRVVEYAKLNTQKCILFTGDDLITDGNFNIDVSKYVDILEHKIPAKVSGATFYDFEPLDGKTNLESRGVIIDIKKIKQFNSNSPGY